MTRNPSPMIARPRPMIDPPGSGSARSALAALALLLLTTNGPAQSAPGPTPDRMLVTGRVLDPQGRPVPGAGVLAYATRKAPGDLPRWWRTGPRSIGDARADASDRFRLDVPRTSSSRYETLGVAATATGHGAAWVELDPDADRPSADITLRPERVIRGRLLDLQGGPAGGVTVRVRSMGHAPRRVTSGRLLPAEDLLALRWEARSDLRGWPSPAVSDDDGRFTLRGIGRGPRVTLAVEGPRFAPQEIELDTDVPEEPQLFTRALEPARILRGRVTDAETGAPVARALLRVLATRRDGRGSVLTEGEADDQGRFRINAGSGDRHGFGVFPPSGSPYLAASRGFDWPRGAVEHPLDVDLPRGVLVHGKVTEEGSGRPVGAATVWFVSRVKGQGEWMSFSTQVDTAADGSFRIAVPPGPGCLSVTGPSDDYVFQAIGLRMLAEGQPGGRRDYAHANVLLDLKPGVDRQQADVALLRGATATGRVVGPDGRPIPDAWIFTRVILQPVSLWRIWRGYYHGRARDGRFQVHGLDPDAEVPVHFLEPQRKLGATVILSGKAAAAGPVTVRLEPCGTAVARLVDPDGQPIARWAVTPGFIQMIVTPGPLGLASGGTGALVADAGTLAQIDPINHGRPLATDAQGRIAIPALIPGADYRFVDPTGREPAGAPIRRAFTVKPGESLDLGDVLIARPRRSN